MMGKYYHKKTDCSKRKMHHFDNNAVTVSLADSKANRWSEPETVVSDGNPRYCAACYDGKGQLWLAYSVQTDRGTEVKVKSIAAE